MNATQYYESIRPERDAWKKSVPRQCMYCGSLKSWPDFEIHEIARRSLAQRSWGKLCNYLLLCSGCHATVFDTLDYASQLAIKLVKDKNNYDLLEWLKIQDPELKAPERVTQSEVEEKMRNYLRQIQQQRNDGPQF